jgi:hypothetical protein
MFDSCCVYEASFNKTPRSIANIAQIEEQIMKSVEFLSYLARILLFLSYNFDADE